MKILSLLGISVLICTSVFSQRGKNGDYTSATANVVANAYTSLTSNATAGSTSISVAANALTSTVLTSPLAPGDLLLIIQMQGATMDIDVTPTVSWGGVYTAPFGHLSDWYDYQDLWGQVTSYNQAGKFEYAQVASVSGANTITLSCGLTNGYDIAGHVQVVRVPRFNNVTLNTGASIVPAAWDGTIGGIVVMEINGNLVLNTGTKIEASGKGFRGGTQSDNVSAGSADAASVNNIGFSATSNNGQGAEKGEGIGGFTTEYDALYSRYGRSAPANGGGGGSNHNTGGGGGSNVGSGTYTGKGIPNNSSPAYAAIWNLESAGFATSSSSGGGRGGYSYSISDQNETTLGPNNLAWSGDYRRNNGGLGGHPLTLDATRIFMGGGGGAGEQNNNQGGGGGAGGGIVMLQVFGAVSGTGTIESSGASGGSTNPNNNSAGVGQILGQDGAGGGGGGGSVMISSSGAMPSGIVILAKGGVGGNQNLSIGNFANPNQADGPGGGGAGGRISITSGTPVMDVSGAMGGITNSSQVSQFPPNGATNGAAGLTSSDVNFYDLIVTNDTICSDGSVTLTATVSGTLPAGATVGWYTDPYAGSPFATGLSYTTPTLSSTTTYYVGACPGDFRKPVQVVVGSDPVISGTAVVSDVTCAGNDGSVTGLTVSGGTPSYTYSWNGTTTSGPDLTGAISGTYTLTVTDNTGCTASSGPYTIASAGGPVIDASAVVITDATCAGNDGSITGITQTGGVEFSWNGVTDTDLDATGLAPGTYTLTVTDVDGCNVTSGPYTISAPAGPSIDESAMTITAATCGNDNGSISGIVATGTGLAYEWNGTSSVSEDISNVPAGSYTLVVTDDQGCSSTSGPHVIQDQQGPSIDLITMVITPETCELGNGSITGIAVSGGLYPYSVSWTNTSQTTIDIANLTAGNYTITVTDANNCSVSSGPHIVTAPPLPVINTASAVITPESCDGNNGSITGLTVTGSGLIFTFTWSNSGTTLDQTGLSGGDYTITATDENNCTTTATLTVPSVPGPEIDDASVVVTQTSCGENNGSITGLTSTAGVTYSWSGTSQTSLDITGLGAGTYLLTATDANGCQDQAGPFTINPSAGPSAAFSYTPSVVLPGSSVQFTDLSTGNIVSWDWNIGGATFTSEDPTYVFESGGVYPAILTVIDQAGCESTASQTIIVLMGDLQVPNVLTRNGDGINDLFEIEGLKPQTRVEILNRWGNVVFVTSDYQNNWTGEDLNGEMLSNGVYTYYIKTPEGDSYQGFVHLFGD